MQNSYGIKLADGRVQIIDLAQKEYIKNNGEQTWDYDEDKFWSFFCKKIGYDGEALSFVILTDQSDLPISSLIHLNHESSITQEAYNHFVVNQSNINVLTKPPISFQPKPQKKLKKKDHGTFFKPSEDNVNAAAKYYRKKTAEYESSQGIKEGK